MDITSQTIDCSRSGQWRPGTHTVVPDCGFFIADIRGGDVPLLPEGPLRFQGYTAFYCQEGGVKLEVNMQPLRIGPGSLVLCRPDHVIRFIEKAAWGGVESHCIAVGFSSEMMSCLPADYRRFPLYCEPVPSPVPVEAAEAALFRRYLDLAAGVVALDVPEGKAVLAPLIYSCYSLLDAAIARTRPPEAAPGGRTRQLFEDFLRLVSEFYRTERGMAFYSGRLGLTPKYLSRLVRQASDRSAPEWIDTYVILDAKNLLRNTNISIKEIVWTLHFPSQSVFSKFFKLHTGMSPSEYRNA